MVISSISLGDVLHVLADADFILSESLSFGGGAESYGLSFFAIRLNFICLTLIMVFQFWRIYSPSRKPSKCMWRWYQYNILPSCLMIYPFFIVCQSGIMQGVLLAPSVSPFWWFVTVVLKADSNTSILVVGDRTLASLGSVWFQSCYFTILLHFSTATWLDHLAEYCRRFAMNISRNVSWRKTCCSLRSEECWTSTLCKLDGLSYELRLIRSLPTWNQSCLEYCCYILVALQFEVTL